ncbi:uracil-DNA glycosylase 2 [Clostridia bacterium]|nr:uracil-DNA glycosylase 2 [Clostridia bacterium]
MINLGNSWDDLLKEEWEKPYYTELREFLKDEYKNYNIYPNMHDIFNALKYTAYEDVKAVILGQDPYHGAGQAHGLCFSVKRGVKPPPSLLNVYAEIASDTGVTFDKSFGELTEWTRNGVLLLNTILTVREGSPQSHKGRGWEILTDKIISLLNERETPVVFLLWGANAKAKRELITNPRHFLLTAAHPSPLSAHNGFFGCRHFSKANEFLTKKGQATIDWRLTP